MDAAMEWSLIRWISYQLMGEENWGSEQLKRLYREVINEPFIENGSRFTALQAALACTKTRQEGESLYHSDWFRKRWPELLKAHAGRGSEYARKVLKAAKGREQ